MPCIVIGDVLVQSASQVAVSRSDGTSKTVTLTAGDWFATPYHLAAYIIEQFNLLGNGGSPVTNYVTVELLDDTADEGKLQYTWSGGTTLSISFATSEIRDYMGHTSNVSSQPTGLLGDTVVEEWCALSFQPVTYGFGSDPESSYAEMAHDGTLYSMRGVGVQTRQIGFNVDVRADYGEYDAFTSVASNRWAEGRYATVYRYGTFTGSAESIGDNADVVCARDSKEFAIARLIEHMDSFKTVSETQYIVRQPVPLSAGYSQARLVQ